MVPDKAVSLTSQIPFLVKKKKTIKKVDIDCFYHRLLLLLTSLLHNVDIVQYEMNRS